MFEYATLDGVVLHDLSTDNNVQAKEVTGLSGIPGVRGDTYDRPEGDGAVEEDNAFFPARVSAWDMAVFGTSTANAEMNWISLNRTLVAAMRSPKQLKWRWINSTRELQAIVRLSGFTPPTFGNGKAGPFVQFQMLLRAADPLNYNQILQQWATGAPSFSISGLPFPIPFPIPWSLVPSGSGTVAVTNDGDVEAWPVIDIAGPVENPIIQNSTSGKSIITDGLSVAVGETLTIVTNDASRSISIGGVSKFSAVRYANSEFFSIAAGATENVSFSGGGTDGNTTMTVSLRSAYIT